MATHIDMLVASDYIVCATLRKVADTFNVEFLWERVRGSQEGVYLTEALKRYPRTARTRQRRESYYSHIIVRVPERDYLRDDRLEDGFGRRTLLDELMMLYEQDLGCYLEGDMEIRYEIEPDTGLRAGEVRFLFGRGIYLPAEDESPAFRVQVADDAEDDWRTVGMIYPNQRLSLLNGDRRASTFTVGGWPFLGGESVLLVQRAESLGSVDVVAEPPGSLTLEYGENSENGEMAISDHRGRGLLLRVVALALETRPPVQSSTRAKESSWHSNDEDHQATEKDDPATEPRIDLSPSGLEPESDYEPKLGSHFESRMQSVTEPVRMDSNNTSYPGADHRGRREPMLGDSTNLETPTDVPLNIPSNIPLESLPPSEWPTPPPSPVALLPERQENRTPRPSDTYLHVIGIALQRLSTYAAVGIRDWRIHFSSVGTLVSGHHVDAMLRLRVDSNDRVFGEIEQRSSTPLDVPSMWQPLPGLDLELLVVPPSMAGHYLGWVRLPTSLDLPVQREREVSFGRGSEVDIAPRLLSDPQALRWKNVESSGNAGINAEYLGLSRCHLCLQARGDDWWVKLESQNMPAYRLTASGASLDVLTQQGKTSIIAKAGELLVAGGYVLALGEVR